MGSAWPKVVGWVFGTTATPQELGLLTLFSLGSDFNAPHLNLKKRPWNTLTSLFLEHADTVHAGQEQERRQSPNPACRQTASTQRLQKSNPDLACQTLTKLPTRGIAEKMGLFALLSFP